nr:hypothetical protein StreXyl84_55690 [Streptomyces sp. Xyl84]
MGVCPPVAVSLAHSRALRAEPGRVSGWCRTPRWRWCDRVGTGRRREPADGASRESRYGAQGLGRRARQGSVDGRWIVDNAATRTSELRRVSGAFGHGRRVVENGSDHRVRGAEQRALGAEP